MRNGVLPLLEDVVRAEVARGVGKQVAAGVSDSVNKTLPPEIERLLVRPDVSAHVARTFSQAVTPLVERHVKDAITHTLVPAYTAVLVLLTYFTYFALALARTPSFADISTVTGAPSLCRFPFPTMPAHDSWNTPQIRRPIFLMLMSQIHISRTHAQMRFQSCTIFRSDS